MQHKAAAGIAAAADSRRAVAVAVDHMEAAARTVAAADRRVAVAAVAAAVVDRTAAAAADHMEVVPEEVPHPAGIAVTSSEKSFLSVC